MIKFYFGNELKKSLFFFIMIFSLVTYANGERFKKMVKSSIVIAGDTDGDGISDTDESTLCRNPNSAVDFALEFDGNAIFGTPTAMNTSYSETGGVIKGLSSTGDPQTIKNDFLQITGSQITSITVRIKADKDGNFQLFWKTTEFPGGFAVARSVTVAYVGDGTFKNIVVDLSLLDWKNKIITGLRIDPTNMITTNWEIDYMRANGAVDPAAPCNLSVLDFNAENAISLSPNPANVGEKIYFEGIEPDSDLEVVVYDITGKVINAKLDGASVQIKTTNKGVYFVKFILKNTTITKKVLIK